MPSITLTISAPKWAELKTGVFYDEPVPDGTSEADHVRKLIEYDLGRRYARGKSRKDADSALSTIDSAVAAGDFS